MKIKDGFVLREVRNNYVVVAVGKRSNEFKGVINLNESGALLFKALNKDVTKEDLIQVLLDNYEVSPEKARESVDMFIKKLIDGGLIE